MHVVITGHTAIMITNVRVEVLESFMIGGSTVVFCITFFSVILKKSILRLHNIAVEFSYLQKIILRTLSFFLLHVCHSEIKV